MGRGKKGARAPPKRKKRSPGPPNNFKPCYATDRACCPPSLTLKAILVEEWSSELSKLDENLDLPPLTLIAVSVEEVWRTRQAGHES